MFEKISKNKLKMIFVFKYFFQLLLIPFLYGLLLILIALVISIFKHGVDYAIKEVFILNNFGQMNLPSYVGLILVGFVPNLVNILSIIPFIKLIVDCISRDNEETKEIEFANIFPMYELQCIRQSKRFMCDTFSRKKNVEVFIYDEHKTKYRLFWNENYGDVEKEEEMSKAKRLRISYFKHSKIIFRCEVLEEEN